MMNTLKLLLALIFAYQTILANRTENVKKSKKPTRAVRYISNLQILGQRPTSNNPNQGRTQQNEIDQILSQKARSCDTEAVRYAISKGANVNVGKETKVNASQGTAAGAILGSVASNGGISLPAPLSFAIGKRPSNGLLGRGARASATSLFDWVTYNDFKLEEIRHIPCMATIRVLLEAGADPNSPPNQRPLQEAAANPDYAEILELLLKYGAKPDLTDSHGETALMVLVQGLFSDLTHGAAAIDYLLDPKRAVDYEQVKNRQITPSGVYVVVGNMAVDASVGRDITQGVYLENNTPEKRFEKAKLLAWRIQSVMRQFQILTSKSDVNARDQQGRTALRIAVENDNLFMVRELLKVGADPNIRDNKGSTLEDFIMLGSRINEVDRKTMMALLRQASQLRGKPLYSYSPPVRLASIASPKSQSASLLSAKPAQVAAASTKAPVKTSSSTSPKGTVRRTAGKTSATNPSAATGQTTSVQKTGTRPTTAQPATSNAQQADRQLTVTAVMPNEKRYALIIGNGAYSASPLLNPPNDARAIAATLKQLGFEVNSQVNVSQRDLKVAVRDFGEKLSQGGVGLFYYAGHGIQIKGRNYLVPVSAAIQRESDVEIECVDMDAILSQMERNGGTNIVILDACRNNPFARSWRSASQGLAQMNAPSGTFIAYATAPGSVASDGSGQNGLYTEELLKAVREPSVSIEEVFKKVRVQVKARSKGMQVPWDSSSLEGAFYFVPGKNAGPSQNSATDASSLAANNATGNGKMTPPASPATSARGLDVIERNYSSGLYDDVIRDAQALIARTPEDAKLNSLLGASYFERKQYQQGEPYLQKAISLGTPVKIKLQRHRTFLLEEKLEAGTITLSKEGVDLQFGSETAKIPLNGIIEIVAERGGLAAMPRLHLKAKVQESGGKMKEKIFNIYGFSAEIKRVAKGTATQGQVYCNESDCQTWAAEMIKIINSMPR